MPVTITSGKTWKHTKSGGLYRIVGTAYNTITDRVDVVYEPVNSEGHERFTRQLYGHDKAWFSKSDDGTDRFALVDE